MKTGTNLAAGGLLVLFAAVCIVANAAAAEVKSLEDTATVVGGPAEDAAPATFATDTTVSFSAIAAFPASGEARPGAPYSATAVTEIEQRFWDGNRISQRSTAEVYRDGAGRVRRDQPLVMIGPWMAPPDAPATTIILDPVAAVTHVLDHQAGTVHTMTMPSAGAVAGHAPGMPPRMLAAGSVMVFSGTAADSDSAVIRPLPPAAGVRVPHLPPPAIGATAGVFGSGNAAWSVEPAEEESLGVQTFEGVEATGIRSVTTIPAGAIGNELAIEIVSERWHSAELGVLIMSRHTDPRVGETVFRLENIRLGEPPAALFRVPGDYRLLEPPVNVMQTFQRTRAPAGSRP